MRRAWKGIALFRKRLSGTRIENGGAKVGHGSGGMILLRAAE